MIAKMEWICNLVKLFYTKYIQGKRYIMHEIHILKLLYNEMLSLIVRNTFIGITDEH